MKTKYVEPEPGTIRGPWTCGTGLGPDTGVQFAVKDTNGCWRYFIEKGRVTGEAKARQRAEEFAASLKSA